MPLVVSAASPEATCAGDAPGLACRYSAATPTVCGVAMEVPLMVFVEVSVRNQSDVMFSPGANQSTQEPTFENEARASFAEVAPTVMACGTSAGEGGHASGLSFPGATPEATPSAIEFLTAWSSAAFTPPPRLMFATAGCPAWWFEVTQSMPAMTHEVSPVPAHDSTRTPTSVTPLATP